MMSFRPCASLVGSSGQSSKSTTSLVWEMLCYHFCFRSCFTVFDSHWLIYFYFPFESDFAEQSVFVFPMYICINVC